MSSGPLRLLLVEGQDDKHVVLHIQRRLEAEAPLPGFCATDKDGIEELLKSIPVEVKVADREVLGIMVDANDARLARWQSIIDRLRGEGIEVPHDIDPNGTVFDHHDLGPSRGSLAHARQRLRRRDRRLRRETHPKVRSGMAAGEGVH